MSEWSGGDGCGHFDETAPARYEPTGVLNRDRYWTTTCDSRVSGKQIIISISSSSGKQIIIKRENVMAYKEMSQSGL